MNSQKEYFNNLESFIWAAYDYVKETKIRLEYQSGSLMILGCTQKQFILNNEFGASKLANRIWKANMSILSFVNDQLASKLEIIEFYL